MDKKNRKTYEYVFNYFSEKIVSGELKLNDKIPTERDIAEQLQVSRNSVREVMHMLEITGLIECVQGSGNYVRCEPEEYMLHSVHMVMSLLNINYLEVFDIRCAYEYTALKLAINAATEDDIEKIRDVLTRMEKPLSIKESANLDMHFHNYLVEASHNRMLILYSSMIGNLLGIFIEDMRGKILMDKARAQKLQKAHQEIFESIIEKDYPKGRLAMEQHFDIVGKQVEKMQSDSKE